MADSEATKETSCSFLFKKSTKKFAGRKRKASDSDKGRAVNVSLCFYYFCCFISRIPPLNKTRTSTLLAQC